MSKFVDQAVEVYRNVPDWGEMYFSKKDCLVAVGMAEEAAESESNQRQMRRQLKGLEQAHGPPYHPNNEEENTMRAVYLASLITVNPTTGKKASLTFVMQVAGFPAASSGPGKDHMRVSRRWGTAKKKKQVLDSLPTQASASTNKRPPVPPQATAKARAPQAKAKAPSNVAVKPPRVVHLSDDDSSDAPSILSPLSSASTSGSVNRKESAVTTEKEFEIYNTPPIFDYSETMPPPFTDPLSDVSSLASSSNISFKNAKQRPKNINSAISHLTTSQTHRRTTQAAQVERQTERELENIRKSMYKAGTVIYKSRIG
ncbi:unknown protein [Seminavis robusta]|uniref:Uncharacterized protein n=1 Tax=Seminavis robusta TaxID=568900 RepID=A0A9N8EFL2_9STRA|nr:unknown protein [Seminavis robusta]|eukprot:Sro1113_g242640.1 n/a (314) ;mRNA; f:16706-17745